MSPVLAEFISSEVVRSAMADPSPSDLPARIQQLERELRDLRLRLADIERRLDPRHEHPEDKTAVREKVAYDWQA